MGYKVCKECGRRLPNGYAGDVCEHCKAERNEAGANVVKGILGIAAGIAAGVAAVAGISRLKGNNNKK